jgi:DnaJ-class molecular chaperone
MDYYSTLGLKRGATDADIKKAYRSMAMKHHPDRGGDETKFKEISQAYEYLSDPQKKQMIDAGIDPNQQQQGFHNQGPFEYHFGAGNFEDIFNNFGFGGGFTRQPRQNKSLNINIEITLEDVLQGKEINAEIGIPGGKTKIINISIPKGIEHGQQIRYSGMGDNSHPNLRPGDLFVNIFVRPHPIFKRDGDSLIVEKTISVWDALVGASVDIETIDKKRLTITVPTGTQPETVLSCKGEGFPNPRTKQRGNLLIKIKVSIPKNLTNDQIENIRKIRDNGI